MARVRSMPPHVLPLLLPHVLPLLLPLLLLLLLLPGLAACRERPPPFTASLLVFADEATRRLALQSPSSTETARELRRLVERGRSAIAAGGHPVDRLNQLVFDELGFQHEVHDTSPEVMLLPHVLARRRGNCLGLSTLYLALGEALALPLEGVLVPGHFFVRYRRGDGGADERRVELLRRGEPMPRRWYVEKYRVPLRSRAGPYLRGLTPEEVLAVLRYNVANELRLYGRLREALACYRAVIAVLPDYAEAHANLGLTHQLLEEHDDAERAYRRAALANPALPGLGQNLAELQRARRATAQRSRGGSRPAFAPPRPATDGSSPQPRHP